MWKLKREKGNNIHNFKLSQYLSRFFCTFAIGISSRSLYIIKKGKEKQSAYCWHKTREGVTIKAEKWHIQLEVYYYLARTLLMNTIYPWERDSFTITAKKLLSGIIHYPLSKIKIS